MNTILSNGAFSACPTQFVKITFTPISTHANYAHIIPFNSLQTITEALPLCQGGALYFKKKL